MDRGAPVEGCRVARGLGNPLLHLVDGRLRPPPVRPVRDGGRPGREAFEGAVKRVVARGPAIEGHALHRLLALPEGPDHRQAVPRQEGLFTAAHALRQVHAVPQRPDPSGRSSGP